MLADMHRARMLAQNLPQFGWDVEVLVPGTAFQRDIWIEKDAVAFRPPNTPVHEVKPKFDQVFKMCGVGSVGWRSFWPLYQRGLNLLKTRRFDLIYISTTQFILFCLGPLWLRKAQVPYVLDFHDPWYREERRHITTRHSVKFVLSNWIAKVLERFAVTRAAGLTAVSPRYLDTLRHRYPKLQLANSPWATFPFAVSERDFKLTKERVTASIEVRESSRAQIVYVGAGGDIMMKSFMRIIDGLVNLKQREPQLLQNVEIKLFGTFAYWQPGEPRPLQEAAERSGLDFVEERPARIPYFRALELITNADGLLILGVDDPAYMPSKLFTYALTGKPMLVSLHHRSQADHYFKEMPGLGHLVHFNSDADEPTANTEFVSYLTEVNNRSQIDRRSLIADYLSPMAAGKHSDFFESVLSS